MYRPAILEPWSLGVWFRVQGLGLELKQLQKPSDDSAYATNPESGSRPTSRSDSGLKVWGASSRRDPHCDPPILLAWPVTWKPDTLRLGIYSE